MSSAEEKLAKIRQLLKSMDETIADCRRILRGEKQ